MNKFMYIRIGKKTGSYSREAGANRIHIRNCQETWSIAVPALTDDIRQKCRQIQEKTGLNSGCPRKRNEAGHRKNVFAEQQKE